MTRCRKGVSEGGRGVGFFQCSRKGKYPDDEGILWCKQHHPDTLAAKKEAFELEYAKDRLRHTIKYTYPALGREVMAHFLRHGRIEPTEKILEFIKEIEAAQDALEKLAEEADA